LFSLQAINEFGFPPRIPAAAISVDRVPGAMAPFSYLPEMMATFPWEATFKNILAIRAMIAWAGAEPIRLIRHPSHLPARRPCTIGPRAVDEVRRKWQPHR